MALGAQRNAEAVGAGRIDAQGQCLAVIGKDFDDAAVDKDPQPQRLFRTQAERRYFRGPGGHIAVQRRAAVVQYQGVLFDAFLPAHLADGPMALAQELDGSVLAAVAGAQDAQFQPSGLSGVDF